MKNDKTCISIKTHNTEYGKISMDKLNPVKYVLAERFEMIIQLQI